jgi:Arc/MetJ-type ribon-helix-helix transcriptional regulator
MASLHISLPPSMKDTVEDRAKDAGFNTVSEYVEALIREDLKGRELRRIEALVVEGAKSGGAIEGIPEYWARKREELIERQPRRNVDR